MSKLRGRQVLVTKDTADAFRPILEWVRAAAPRREQRQAAYGVLSGLKGIKDWKLVLLTGREYDMYEAVLLAFPGGTTPLDSQLKLL